MRVGQLISTVDNKWVIRVLTGIKWQILVNFIGNIMDVMKRNTI